MSRDPEIASADTALDASARTALADGDDVAGAPPAFPGVSIPGYRILNLIGQGGMGAVYAGEQEAPRRPVAIKVLRSQSPTALARFTAEAEIMARLDHPGIARVLEAGNADGHPYLVLERIDGVNLDDRIQDRPLAERIALMAATCEAVHHAHVKGVIHRDLKPSNVMVRSDGRVAVLDFGIARIATTDGASSGDTRAGELIGTPLYMSPEQARLRPDEVDARSDVYSLGVMLYVVAANAWPYGAPGQALPDLTRAICHDDPRPLGAHDRALRGDLEAIAARALAKTPERRYASAAALADDLRRYLDGRTVSARSPGVLERTRRFARRHPATASAIAVAAIGTAIFAIVVTRMWLAAERARVLLEERANQLTISQARATLARDPTEALAMLATVTRRGVDPDQVAAIEAEARGRGVASAVLRGHDDEVRWVEPLPRGGGVVTAGYDGRVLVWTPPFTAPRQVFAGAGRCHVARPSPDGARLAIGRDAGGLVVVDVATGDATPLEAHAHDVERVAWSPDGAWLVSGDDHGGLWLWAGGHAPGRALIGPAGDVEALGFSRDGTRVIAGDEGGRLWQWTIAAPDAAPVVVDTGAHELLAADADGTRAIADDGTVWGTTQGAGTPLRSAAFTPKGTAIFGGDDGRVLANGAELGRHGAPVRAIAGDDTWIASGADDGSLQVWDERSGRHLTLRGHTARIRQLAFEAGDVLWSADGAGVVRRWELAAIPPNILDGHRAAIDHLAVSSGGTWLASVDVTGEVWRWSLVDGGAQRLGDVHARVRAIAIAGDAAVTAAVDGAVAWWKSGWSHRASVGATVLELAASRDGTWIAIATAAGPIHVLAGDGADTPAVVLAGHDDGTEAVAFDPTGTLLASGGQDREVRVWRPTGGEVAHLSGPTGDTHHVAWSPAGDLLIAAGNDGAVRAWTVHDGVVDAASQRVLAQHTGAVDALAIGGGAVVSAGRDRRLVRVDLATGAVTETVTPAITIHLAVDDTRILVVDASGAVRAWHTDVSRELVLDATAALGAGDVAALGLADGRIELLGR